MHSVALFQHVQPAQAIAGHLALGSMLQHAVPRLSISRQMVARSWRSLRVPYIRGMSHRPSEPLPEDTTPAMWQRVAQLIAGTVATGSFAYFVLLGDFGEGDHCFVPIRQALNVDAPAWRAKLWPRSNEQHASS